MNVITIDPGKYSIGYCIRTKKDLIIDSIGFKKSLSTEKIMLQLHDAILKLCAEFDLDKAFIEDYAFGTGNRKGLFGNAEIKGVIKHALYKSCCNVVMMPIFFWKSYTPMPAKTIKGKNNHVNYIEQAETKTGKKFKNIDEVDAYLMMRALVLLKKGFIKSKYAKSVLEELEE